jgi:hypothetical protein
MSLRESRKGPAIRIAFDALNDAEQALEYLKQVVNTLG